MDVAIIFYVVSDSVHDSIRTIQIATSQPAQSPVHVLSTGISLQHFRQGLASTPAIEVHDTVPFSQHAVAFKERYYAHQSVNPREYELFCFNRWHILYEFTRSRLGGGSIRMRWLLADGDVAITRPATWFRSEHADVSIYLLGALSVWSTRALEDFAEYLLWLYNPSAAARNQLTTFVGRSSTNATRPCSPAESADACLAEGTQVELIPPVLLDRGGNSTLERSVRHFSDMHALMAWMSGMRGASGRGGRGLRVHREHLVDRTSMSPCGGKTVTLGNGLPWDTKLRRDAHALRCSCGVEGLLACNISDEQVCAVHFQGFKKALAVKALPARCPMRRVDT